MQTHIIQIDSIKELLTSGHIQPNSVIYWDLDNTVYQPTKELGSDQWFEHFYHIAQSKLAASFKFELMLKTYNAIQAHVEVMPVEPKTIKIIKYLNAMGIQQGFLTARNNDLEQITIQQLQAVGIDAYEYPIIFCDGQDKGKVLMAHLSSSSSPSPSPSHIIMIDDKLKNIQNIEKAAIKKNISFTGFHYNFLLEKVKSFDIGFAHFQLSCIQHHLPHQVQNFVDALELSWEPQHEDEEYSQPFRKAI